ncbi:High affinity potassium transporter [Hypsizygus marmoreus]|uniref:High affinity potassium transporter n=1 Tax=Hypsizygus marmoreus TaxID=39966 RepID=A0A369J7Q4_HYPMA|nr:High affinity potassium transporter [Hypsizygus marmoreus]
MLSFQTLGIIYSDIGTSPLYVLNGIWPGAEPSPSEEDIIGGVSAIVWSLSLLPLLKYVFISLRFGTREGEGGSFALFQGLFPPVNKDYDADRTLTGDSLNDVCTINTGEHRIKQKYRWPLLIWCLLGTALTMADGVFTPAVSVTSAVGGIAVAKPSVTENIIPISIVILLALFFVQKYGTERIAFIYAPVSFAWFLLLAGTGIYNITFAPGIFRTFDPSRAVLLFVRTKDYDLLSGVLLAVTGCEAIFANIGQFNALSIQLSFACFTYPALVLAYLGQGARLIHDGDSVISNVFYNTIPGPRNGALFWIVFIFAVLATIIASQAMITATFSLVQQLINTKSFPPIRMHYTSEIIQGQVYIPAINYALMIACIVVVAVFSNLAHLTNAYGFAVATVMLSTSLLIAVQIYYVKQLPLAIALGFLVVFGFFDGLFWGASLKKFPLGAWVPFLIGMVLLSIMTLWSWAKGLEDKFDGMNRKNLRHFIQQDDGGVTFDDSESMNDADQLTDRDLSYYYMPDFDVKPGSELAKRRKLQRIPTCAVFHKIAEGKGVPHTFIGFIRQWPALPRVVIFLSVGIVPVARVPIKDRYVVTKVRTIEGFYGVTYYIGFRDNFDVKIDDLIEKICEIESQVNPRGSAALVEEIRSIAHTATHIAPHYHVVSKKVDAGLLSTLVNWIRKYLIEDIYRRLATMFPETGNWLTSADEIIHVGINAVI